MKRREAIRAIMAIPAVTSISVARLKPDDVIVLECDQALTQDMADQLTKRIREIWPEPQKVVVMANGMRMKILRANDV